MDTYDTGAGVVYWQMRQVVVSPGGIVLENIAICDGDYEY